MGIKLKNWRFKNIFDEIILLLDWVKFDLFSLSIRKNSKQLKMIFYPQVTLAPSYIQDLDNISFENSLTQKVLTENSLLVNYIQRDSYSENQKLKASSIKMGLHFPIFIPNKMEGCLNLFYNNIENINIVKISEKFLSQKNLIQNTLHNLFLNYFVEDISSQVYENLDPYSTYKQLFMQLDNKDQDDLNTNLEKGILEKFKKPQKGKILIENKIKDEIIHISEDLKKILNIEKQLPKHMEEICHQYEKFKLDFYKKTNLKNAYIPIKFLKNTGKNIEFFVHIPENIEDFLEEDNIENFRFYHFFLKNEIQVDSLTKSIDILNKEIELDEEGLDKQELDLKEINKGSDQGDIKEINDENSKILKKIYDKFESLNLPKKDIKNHINDLMDSANFNIKKNVNTIKKLKEKKDLERDPKRYELHLKKHLPVGNKEIILIVDSNKKSQFLISQFLHQLNYKIKIANNIEEAYDIFNKHPIDLIILDFFVQNFSGFLLIYKIANKLKKIPPFIMISLINNYKIIRDTYNLGALAYLNKNKISLKQLSIFTSEALKYAKIKKSKPLPKLFLEKLDPEIFNFTKSNYKKEFNFTKNTKTKKESFNSNTKNLNLSSLGFNIEEIKEGIKWPDYNSNKLIYSFYFIDHTICILNLKGIFEKKYISEIILKIDEIIEKEQKRAPKIQFILDLSNLLAYGIEAEYLRKLIFKIFHHFAISNFIYITSNQEIIKILTTIHTNIPFMIKESTLECLNSITLKKI